MTHPDKALAIALLEAFIAGGKVKPVLPDGRREEYVALLFALFADRDRFDDYEEALRVEGRRRGLDATVLHDGGDDLPWEVIAAEGFAGVSDDHLAEIAISTSEISALRDTLDDPNTPVGSWYVKARPRGRR